MKRVFLLAAVIAAALSSGCSVYMAAKGEEEPNLTNVRQGASRGEVEMALGQPVTMTTHDDGQLTANYEYVLGNKPSTGRAMGHGVLDVLTLGLWEVVGTPIEAVNQGDKITVTVRYDQQGRAVDIKSSKL